MEGSSKTTCYSLTLGRWWVCVQPLEEAFTSSFSKCTSNPSPPTSLLPQQWHWPGIWRELFVWFGKIRLHCGGCWAGQGNRGKAVALQVQIQWGGHKHLLLKWILMFANWLKAELYSLWRWGAGQTGTPLKMIRSSTFLDSQEFRYDYSAGRSFSGNCGKVKSCSQKSLLCCLFILSDKRLFFISKESPCAPWHTIILIAWK